MLVLLFVVLLFILRWRFVLSLAFYYFVLAFFSPFGIAITSLILELFVCLFDLRLFGFVCFLFLLVSGKGCGLCKSALTPPPVVYSTDRSKAVVPVLVLLFVALWFIQRGDLFYVLPYVILFLCFSVLLALRLPRLGKRELILVLLVRLFDLCLFGFVCFLFLLVSGKGCGL